MRAFPPFADCNKKDELTSAINRVVEDINHRFTLEVLSQDWKSHDLGISASNLRRDRENPTDILDASTCAVTDSLRKLLEIRNRAEQTVHWTMFTRRDQGVSGLVDLTREIDAAPAGCRHEVQPHGDRAPGLRYAQADALIRSLLLDETFSALSLAERTACSSAS
ncbi:MAG: hypothetical protein ACLT4C_03440 [Butyricicoccus sp.]